ncbi:hypothetical protein PPERSA_01614 [Pseudocohnilembus persalinus]|uniref:Transmembrane protein n=1 Tax=Pseudocohnilembus persalinus TaxID=266149 RepID=A0A0V0QI63_PSEPJ|nr:hypothetical protein PPERSA_01614 [Pseudocohnilembus persalinus]|eukprot:KRX01744.1 hypothetical protein PPERSA_01614 [Pseudocohnilembus persalinus]
MGFETLFTSVYIGISFMAFFLTILTIISQILLNGERRKKNRRCQVTPAINIINNNQMVNQENIIRNQSYKNKKSETEQSKQLEGIEELDKFEECGNDHSQIQQSSDKQIQQMGQSVNGKHHYKYSKQYKRKKGKFANIFDVGAQSQSTAQNIDENYLTKLDKNERQHTQDPFLQQKTHDNLYFSYNVQQSISPIITNNNDTQTGKKSKNYDNLNNLQINKSINIPSSDKNNSQANENLYSINENNNDNLLKTSSIYQESQKKIDQQLLNTKQKSFQLVKNDDQNKSQNNKNINLQKYDHEQNQQTYNKYQNCQDKENTNDILDYFKDLQNQRAEQQDTENNIQNKSQQNYDKNKNYDKDYMDKQKEVEEYIKKRQKSYRDKNDYKQNFDNKFYEKINTNLQYKNYKDKGGYSQSSNNLYGQINNNLGIQKYQHLNFDYKPQNYNINSQMFSNQNSVNHHNQSSDQFLDNLGKYLQQNDKFDQEQQKLQKKKKQQDQKLDQFNGGIDFNDSIIK